MLCQRYRLNVTSFRSAIRPFQRFPHQVSYRHLQSAPRRRFPLTPPDPASLPPSRPPRRFGKWFRRTLWTLNGVLFVLIVDRQFYASSLFRSTHTFAVGAIVALDYKINFKAHPPMAKSIEHVHARNAELVFNLLQRNGGLYLKIGQAIAMQSAVLPPEFQKMFSKMFDDAPQNSWADVERVIREDFGKSAEEVFGSTLEHTARASASVAQVHWARLEDGREVAVKIQKREIAQQVSWDLWAFKVVAKAFTKAFDLPFYSLVPYITERLMLETDFVNEADNSERMKGLIEGEPRLKGKVYIPKVFRELSSTRVMTAEWIEGVRLWDKNAITSPWRGSWTEGTPGCGLTPLDLPGRGSVGSRSGSVSNRSHQSQPAKEAKEELLKPERDHWKGPTGRGGLGLSMKDVMGTMVDLFSAQMFLWGWVHCDPHPGNIFVRRKPFGKAELVLIDHGLYIHMNPEFRHQYALFWKSLMTFDNKTIEGIVRSWGIGSPDMFASATLMRPYTGGDQSTSSAIREGLKGKDEAERAFEMQQKMREGIKEMLGDETKWPRELIFIGRNFRIVQGNNQFLGSPVNRVKITGLWASRALAESPDLPLAERIGNFGRHVIFRFVLFGSDVVFLFSKLRQFLGIGGGMEDDLENQMRSMAKGFGVELNHGVFNG